MGEVLDAFVKQAGQEDSHFTIKDMLSEDEVYDWELLVRAFDDINITQIVPDVAKIAKMYKLERWQEISILAYIKILEMMVARTKDGTEIMKAVEGINKEISKIDNSGGMFG
mgnify:CR=1 FL=1